MIGFNVEMLPPSYMYTEVVTKIRKFQIAYCYSGDKNKHAIMFRDINTGEIMTFHSKHEKTEEDDIFELWTFINVIPNGIIRQNALSRWFEVYIEYFGYLGLENYDFKLNK